MPKIKCKDSSKHDIEMEEPEAGVSSLQASLDRYHRQFVSRAELEARVEAIVDAYDIRKEEEKREAKRRATEPDDEGWITVSSKASRKRLGKATRLKRKEVEDLVLGATKKSKSADPSFYAFHGKETRLKKAEELQRKFEDDKKRVAALQNQRKFRPD